MKISRYIAIMAAGAGLFSACDPMEKFVAYSPDDVVAPVLHELPDAIEITSENMANTVTFTWDAADFGVSSQINYSIEAAYNNDTLAMFTGLSGTSSSQTYEALNSPLALAVDAGGLGVPTGIPTEVEFFVSATVGTGYDKYYSEGVKVNMTVTAAERTYPMIYVIGDFNGWADGTTQELFSFSGDEVTYSGVIDFGEKAANGFKIRGTETGWSDDSNWGVDGDAAAPEAEAASVQLISAGSSGNIMAYSGRFYRFSFDRSSLVLTKQLAFSKVGIVGDAVGSWDNDVVMDFNTETQKFYADVTLTAGEMKFRLDAAWTTSWGVETPADGQTSGTLDGGNNIKVPAGNYRVYLNINNPDECTFELNSADYRTGGGAEPEPEPEKADWYVHGQTIATPDWGGTAMVSASNDFKAYKAEGVEVAANSEFLFKSGDESQWLGVNSSFAGGVSPYVCELDVAFEVSGDPKVNAVIKDAGKYDYWLLPDAGIGYVVTAGTVPGKVAGTYGIVGTVNGWGTIGDLVMTEENGYLVRKGVALKTSDSFKIRYNNEWKDDANYGTESGGAVDINTAVKLVSSGGSQNMSVQLDGEYDIWFDLDSSTVYIMSEGRTPAEI